VELENKATTAFARVHPAVPKQQQPCTNRAAVMQSLLHTKPVPHSDIFAHKQATLCQPDIAALEGAPEQRQQTAHHVIEEQYRTTLLDSTPGIESLTVGIVGGGMAGLYAAMILKDLGIDFTVFEASDKRWGGRVYTHHFSELKEHYGYNGIYDYVDLGRVLFVQV